MLILAMYLVLQSRYPVSPRSRWFHFRLVVGQQKDSLHPDECMSFVSALHNGREVESPHDSKVIFCFCVLCEQISGWISGLVIAGDKHRNSHTLSLYKIKNPLDHFSPLLALGLRVKYRQRFSLSFITYITYIFPAPGSFHL